MWELVSAMDKKNQKGNQLVVYLPFSPPKLAMLRGKFKGEFYKLTIERKKAKLWAKMSKLLSLSFIRW